MLPFRNAAGKEQKMPKYFMSGTRYEAFERMMMTPPTRVRSDDAPKEDKSNHGKPNTKEGSAEKNAVSGDTQQS